MTAASHPLSSNYQTARLPVIIDRKKIRIRPTRNGLIFIVLMLAMFLGSINYNNNLGFLLTFLLGSLAFVSIAHSYKNVAGLTIGPPFVKPVFAGQQAVFELIISGETDPRVGIRFAFKDGQSTYYNIGAFENIPIRVSVRAPSRGILKPGPLLIYSDYPLGLFRVGTKINLDQGCIVYPVPRTGKAEPGNERSPDGDDISGINPGSDDFNGLKNYTPGDPIQRISWKASSRGQGVFTKDFCGRYSRVITLDWYSLRAAETEDRLSMLCRLVLDADQNGLRYGLRLPGSSITPDIGRGHRLRCLKALALF